MKCYQNRIILSILLLMVGALSASAKTDPYPKNPNIDALNYRFEFEFSDETDEIQGKTTIDVRFLKDSIRQVRLDFISKINRPRSKGMTVLAVESAGKAVTFQHEEDVLLISLPALSQKDQRHQFIITYRGIPATGLIIGDNKYGDRCFFSDNWPNKGRNWLPMIDHPYDKATCEFIVTAPAHYQVVSNGLLVEETDLTESKRLTHWKQSVPIAPWLYTLGVARFAVQEVDKFEGKSIQTWVYHQDRDAGFYDFAVPSKRALEFYSNYIGPFSYEKLANIQSNAVGGGMEAASAIMYGDNSVSGKRTERWRNIIIHEVAHQWFGNSVTEYDWDDVWLSEGFATYFTLLFIEHEYGRDAFLEKLQKSKETVDRFHSLNPDYRIVHDNLKDMRKVTTIQTYQKGSWILHMLRGVVGTDNFWRGIRSYYHTYRNGHASTSDFRREMEEASGKDLSKFFQQWLYEPGALALSGSWKYNENSKAIEITLNQVQQDDSRFEMPLEIGIHFKEAEQVQLEVLPINKKSNQFTIQVEAEPEEVRLDPNTWVLMDVLQFEQEK
ncbi:MAG: M1 family metallopeptidase [Saprospiraceae bacterium]|nr:M1 family metallopeptidase [Saprospiraceae bacterium]